MTKQRENGYILIIIILLSLLISFIIISDTHTNYLEEENKLLRNELNIKNGKLWQQQIEQNMEKDQPINL